MLTRRSLLSAAPAALLTGAAGAPGSLLDKAALPRASENARAQYNAFLIMNLPRAFAISSNGIAAAAGDALSLDAARQAALRACLQAGGTQPRLYAENLSLVGQAGPDPTRMIRPPLISTWNYRFAPDARFLWYGPAAARGLYIWAHGTSSDPFGLQPPPHVRLFNNAGFDVVRFDREPNADDVDRAAIWLRGGIRTLRAQGWRFVIAGGHSRGAWNCLQMLKTADLADLAIADSPAAHGTAGGFFMSSQTDDLRQIVADVSTTRSRLAFIQFSNDPYIGDADTRRRLVERLRPRLASLLVIDRPPGFEGHLAAREMAFAQRFGPQLLALAG